jgi:hypothetical protein
MYKLVVLAVVLAAANAAVVAPGYAGLPLGYAGHPYAAPAYAHHAYAHPVAAPVIAPQPVQYVAPPPREVVNAPVVEQTVEPVEQWGYSIRY